MSRAIVKRVNLSYPSITRALHLLETFQSPTEALRAEVQTYADEMDSAYLDLSDECEKGLATQEQVSVAFSVARAASAVAFALSDHALVAASEATYEAASAVDDAREITSIAEMILNHNHDI